MTNTNELAQPGPKWTSKTERLSTGLTRFDICKDENGQLLGVVIAKIIWASVPGDVGGSADTVEKARNAIEKLAGLEL